METMANPPTRQPLTKRERGHFVDETAPPADTATTPMKSSSTSPSPGVEPHPDPAGEEPVRRRQGRRRAKPTVSLYVRVDADLMDQLESRAAELDVTKTEAVEAAVRAWLAEKPAS